MADQKVNRNCILAIASRIAQEQPVSESQARDFCNAISGFFSQEKGDAQTQETYKAVARAAQWVIDQLGVPPGYLHKYEPGVEDVCRKRNVRNDYESARKQYGIAFKLDPFWQ